MAGDLNQAVRALSRKGDAPWKRMNGIQLDFTGRVRYIEKNYRNSQEIGEYISHMLQHMNTRLSMLDLINSLEYEYNSFKVGTNPTIALKVRTGVQRTSIKTSVIAAIKEIATTYRISYSDIAVLFPFRKVPYLNYHFLYWLQQGLDEEGISYSMIINEKDGFFVKKKPGDITGVVISTIESSLGLDFKAVILAGLFPYNYVNLNGQVGSEIKTWSAIKNMPEEQQTAVQSQMRAVYTACSRARDVLYVISDLKPGTPMEEIIKQVPDRTPLPQSSTQSGTPPTGVRTGNKRNTVTKRTASATIKERLLNEVVDHVTIKAVIQETKKDTTVMVDLAKYPKQKGIIGKKIGETFKLAGVSLTYKITKIIANDTLIPKDVASSPAKQGSTVQAGKTQPKSLKDFFVSKGFKAVDCRSNNGCLWILGERKELAPYVTEAERLFGVAGGYGAGKASSYKPAWWTKSNK